MGHLTKAQLASISRYFEELARQRDAEDAAAPVVSAIKVTYDNPAPDGTFEILFMSRDDALKFESHFGTAELLSFEEGVELARRPDCCGGQHALHVQAARFQRLNPFVQALNLNLN